MHASIYKQFVPLVIQQGALAVATNPDMAKNNLYVLNKLL